MVKDYTRKKDGFQGQKAIVIPRKLLFSQCTKNNVIDTLYITDIGYFPNAKFHFRERLHGAEQHILIFCHEGSGTLIIKKETYIVNAGDFIIIPMKTSHIYSANEKNPWSIFWVHFKGKVSNDIVALIENKINGYKGFIQNYVQIISLFNEIYSQLERGYSTDNLLYSNLCFGHFLTMFIYNQNFKIGAQFQSIDEIDKAIDFLKQNIDQTLTLEKVANNVNLSPSHLSFLFKKKTGFSIIEYFNHLKIQKVCQYLLFTNMRIREIALEIGFLDPYYLSRVFTKIIGMSPNQYRKKRSH